MVTTPETVAPRLSLTTSPDTFAVLYLEEEGVAVQLQRFRSRPGEFAE